MKNKSLFLIIPLLLMGGCSNEQDYTVPKPILKEQTEALEKAKQVEQILQKGVDRNNQIIEEQSK